MKRPPRPPVEVTVDGLDGDGIATGLDARGRRWTLRGAAPGSVVLAGGRCGSGTVLGVVRPAPDAVAPRCPVFGTCGGCSYQTVPLQRQRAAKHAALAALLSTLGAPGAGPIGTAGEGYGYRNRMELSYGVERYLTRDEQARVAGGEEMERAGRFLGLHGAGRFDRIVDLEACAIASPAINRVLARARAETLSSPFPMWSPRAQTGFWRHLGLREGTEGVVALVYTTPGGEEEAAWLREHAPTWGAAAVLWYTTERTADAAVGDLRAVLHGEPRLAVSLAGVPLRLSPLAFFQVNPTGAELLLQVIRGALRGGEGPPDPAPALPGVGSGLLLDLYCGVGALGLALHEEFSGVAGIDLVAEGVAEAMRNAADLGVRADYRAGPAEKLLPDLLRDHGCLGAKGQRLAVLVDPPRGGLHPDALAPLCTLEADVLVYVACRPSSLARDGARLVAAGWRCTGWTAVDLFPHTAHVEVVARFVRGHSGRSANTQHVSS